MNKFLKLTGVSVLAIVATTGANAAGYTCEELIEYTACNDGWYLNDGDCIESTTCPSGSYLRPFCSVGDCALDYDFDTNEYMCCGGEYVANLECTQCPSVGLTDKDGKLVTVKSQPGSMGVGSCYIDPNAYFENEAGIYHYKSNCSMRFWETSPDTAEECVDLGLSWGYTENGEEACVVYDEDIEPSGFLKTEEECNAAAEKIDNLEWGNGGYYGSSCYCTNDYGDGGTGIIHILGSDTWYCGQMGGES